jgi:antitoxin VapB
LPVVEAKLFRTGRSQAVRLPKQFRFAGDRVRIRKVGQAVILEPIETDWAWLDQIEPLDDDAVAAALQQPAPQTRPELKRSFR